MFLKYLLKVIILLLYPFYKVFLQSLLLICI